MGDISDNKNSVERELEAQKFMNREYEAFYELLNEGSKLKLRLIKTALLEFSSWLGLTDEAAYQKVGEFIKHKHHSTVKELRDAWGIGC